MVHLTRLKAIIVVSMLIMLVAAEILYILGIVAVERLSHDLVLLAHSIDRS